MENKKHLKWSSIAILALTGFTLLQLVFEMIFGELNNAELPEGSPANILLITKIFVLCVSALLMIPSIYVGIKGLKVAKNPDASRAHIIWAIILFALSVVSLVEPLLGVIGKENTRENIDSLLSILVSVSVYFDYIKEARAVRKEYKE